MIDEVEKKFDPPPPFEEFKPGSSSHSEVEPPLPVLPLVPEPAILQTTQQPPLLAQHPLPASNAQSPSSPYTGAIPPTYFDPQVYEKSVQDLEVAMNAYSRSKKKVSRALRTEMEVNIEGTMRQLAEIHPDPAIKQSWATKASTFAAKASKSRHIGLVRATVMTAKGLAVICLFPIRLTGGILLATGYVIGGTGDALKFGGKGLMKVGKII